MKVRWMGDAVPGRLVYSRRQRPPSRGDAVGSCGGLHSAPQPLRPVGFQGARDLVSRYFNLKTPKPAEARMGGDSPPAHNWP